MKPQRIGLFVLLATLVGISSLHGQTRVAYIDASKLLKRMPEAIDAATRLDQVSSTWQREAGDMQNDLDRKQANFDRRKLIMTDAERSASDLDVQNSRKRLDEYRHQKFDPVTGELFTQEASLMKPAYERLQNAIHEAALDGNYDYVFDVSSKDIVMLYRNSKFDLTIAVARKLGIESEILTTPLINDGPKSSGAKPAPHAPNVPPPNQSANPLSPGNPQPTQQPPAYNSGGFNPGQIPPPPPPVEHK